MPYGLLARAAVINIPVYIQVIMCSTLGSLIIELKPRCKYTPFAITGKCMFMCRHKHTSCTLVHNGVTWNLQPDDPAQQHLQHEAAGQGCLAPPNGRSRVSCA